LLILLKRLEFHQELVRQVLEERAPKWTPVFIGIQPLLFKGLFSDLTEDVTIQCIIELIDVPSDAIVQPQPNRFAITVVALLPYICHRILLKRIPTDVVRSIARTCHAHSHSRLGKVFESLTANDRSLAGFLADLAKPLCQVLFPSYSYFTMSFLFALINEGPKKYRSATMQIIRQLLISRSISDWHGSSKSGVVWAHLLCKELFNVEGKDNWEAAIDSLSFAIIQAPVSFLTLNTAKIVPPKHLHIQSRFSDQPGEGTTVTSAAIAQVLLDSEETRERSLKPLDSTIFDLFGHESDESDMIEHSGSEESLSEYATLRGGTLASCPTLSSNNMSPEGTSNSGEVGTGFGFGGGTPWAEFPGIEFDALLQGMGGGDVGTEVDNDDDITFSESGVESARKDSVSREAMMYKPDKRDKSKEKSDKKEDKPEKKDKVKLEKKEEHHKGDRKNKPEKKEKRDKRDERKHHNDDKKEKNDKSEKRDKHEKQEKDKKGDKKEKHEKSEKRLTR